MINRSTVYQNIQIYRKLFPSSLFTFKKEDKHLNHFTSLTQEDWNILIPIAEKYGIAENMLFLRDFFQRLAHTGNITYTQLYNTYLKEESKLNKVTVSEKQAKDLADNVQALDNASIVRVTMVEIAKTNASHIMEVLDPVKHELMADLGADDFQAVEEIEKLVQPLCVTISPHYTITNEDAWKVILKFAELTGMEESFNFLHDYLKMLEGDVTVTRTYIYNKYIREGVKLALNIDDNEALKDLRKSEGKDLDSKTKEMREIAVFVAGFLRTNIVRRFPGAQLEGALKDAKDKLAAESSEVPTKTRSKTKSTKL